MVAYLFVLLGVFILVISEVSGDEVLDNVQCSLSQIVI